MPENTKSLYLLCFGCFITGVVITQMVDNIQIHGNLQEMKIGSSFMDGLTAKPITFKSVNNKDYKPKKDK